MMKNNIPTARYAALSDLESLQLEKAKIRIKLRKQEGNLKAEVDDLMDVFRLFGSLAGIVKQISSAIPFLSSIKMFLKLFGFFGK
jgi:hypothetical protein